MESYIGKVLEVYIPEQYKNNNLLDIMDRDLIGFKVDVNNEIMDIVVLQNSLDKNIYKDDLVIVTKNYIDNHEFIDINLYSEE